jgi:hypothetical protein
MMATIEWGNAAECFGAVAAALAFGATSLAIWSAHRHRVKEHDEAMFDEALKVVVSVGLGSEYAYVETERGKERLPNSKVNATVTNDGRREITDVEVVVTSMEGTPLGTGATEFIQAGRPATFQFDAIDEVYAPFGSNVMVRALATLTFEDISKTRWRRTPMDDRLVRLHKPKWRQGLSGAVPRPSETLPSSHMSHPATEVS